MTARPASPTPQECEGKHDWFVPGFIGYACCRKCGIVKRGDGQNKPCRGVVHVELRETAS